MVKLNTDGFLNKVSKAAKSNIIRLTIKRDLVSQHPELRKALKHPKRAELLQSIKPELKDIKNVVFRFTDGSVKCNTTLNSEQISKFADSLSNIFRLNCLPQKLEQKKKLLLLPTPPNPKSKTQQSIKLKKLRNKERRVKRKQLGKIKKRQVQREKTFASKKLKEQQERV